MVPRSLQVLLPASQKPCRRFRGLTLVEAFWGLGFGDKGAPKP